MVQTVIVLIILALAGVYLFMRFRRSLSGGGCSCSGKCGCAGCNSCSAPQKKLERL